MRKLTRPCPFCGSSDLRIEHGRGAIAFRCEHCQARGPSVRNRGKSAEILVRMISAWNERAAPELGGCWRMGCDAPIAEGSIGCAEHPHPAEEP